MNKLFYKIAVLQYLEDFVEGLKGFVENFAVGFLEDFVKGLFQRCRLTIDQEKLTRRAALLPVLEWLLLLSMSLDENHFIRRERRTI